MVSPDHALLIDGVLVNAGKLVNGVSIVQDLATSSVQYFHVELDAHDILLADGMPAESYLDTGNRDQFANGAAIVALHPDFAAKRMQSDACAPFVEDGPVLAGIRQRLIAELTARGYALSDDAQLRVVVDGQVLTPLSVDGASHRFALPDAAQDIRIVSRQFTPAGSTATADARRLGVCLGGIVAHAGATARSIALDDPALGHGFHAVEGNDSERWRWTDGEARLPATLLSGLAGITLELTLAWPGNYWVQPEPAEPVRLSA